MFADAKSFQLSSRTLLISSLLLTLAACDGSSHSNEGKPNQSHQHEKIDSAGRLLISAADSALVHVYDIKQQRPLSSFDTKLPIQAIYASPNNRYGVVVHRADNKVSFIDGGLWQEDHGDHDHDYQQTPKLLSFQLQGPAPTHYEAHQTQAAIFFDGATNPAQASQVQLISDDSISKSQVSGQLNLARNMHGTAEPRGQHLLVTYRPASASNTLPTQVEWYQRNGSSYSLVEKFAEQCPGLHGSYSNKDYSMFGCTDGVLVVEQKADKMIASKIVNPPAMAGRIGTITGHKNLNSMIGFAGQDMYLLDPTAKTMTLVNWRDNSQVTRVAFSMSGKGDYFGLLDNTGRLTVLNVQAGFGLQGRTALLTSLSSTNPPVIAANLQNNDIFVTDTANQQIFKVDLSNLNTSTIKLNFTPAKMHWVGIPNPAK